MAEAPAISLEEGQGGAAMARASEAMADVQTMRAEMAAPSGFDSPGEASVEVRAAVSAGISTAVPSGAVDPLSEAPQAVWYIRPATGGQFGPATAEIMRQWLKEGRIGSGSLVWREGWRDWQDASATFPQLGGGTGIGTILVQEDAPGPSRAVVRRRHGGPGWGWIALLFVSFLALLSLFFWILRQQS